MYQRGNSFVVAFHNYGRVLDGQEGDAFDVGDRPLGKVGSLGPGGSWCSSPTPYGAHGTYYSLDWDSASVIVRIA